MPRSKRHHFVPQFLMKYFLNKNKKLYVYDKIDDRFYENSTENLFLEKDRNTFLNLEGINDDIIERIYSDYDSHFSNILREITQKKEFNSKIIKSLIFLAYFSKWRVRGYDKSFKEAKEYFTVGDLGLGFKNENNDKIDFDLEQIFDSDMHQEFKRILLSIQPLRFKDDFKKIFDNTFLISTRTPSFISDCPFNEAAFESDLIFEDFVFPIMSDLTLVHSTRIDKFELQNFINNGKEIEVQKFLNDFSASRDISMLALCERNVACASEEYLKHIVEKYKNAISKNAKTPINLSVFYVLYKFTEYTSR